MDKLFRSHMISSWVVIIVLIVVWVAIGIPVVSISIHNFMGAIGTSQNLLSLGCLLFLPILGMFVVTVYVIVTATKVIIEYRKEKKK